LVSLGYNDDGAKIYVISVMFVLAMIFLFTFIFCMNGQIASQGLLAS
jgi:hypothetical protein